VLIQGCCQISSLYDLWYPHWCSAIQGNDVAERLKKEDKEGLEKSLFNHYTIIQMNEKGEFFDLPYGTFFKEQIVPIAQAFENLIKELEGVGEKSEEQERIIHYLGMYRECLLEEKKEELENKWKRLDEIWMDIKYPIQIVHDIEYGYGDPLRIKVIPDFSVRFVDSGYAEGNLRIEEIKKFMVKHFKGRDKELAKKGVAAVENSFAAIYYLPFQCATSLHFRFSGQSKMIFFS